MDIGVGLWDCWNVFVLVREWIVLAPNSIALGDCTNFHFSRFLLLLCQKVSQFFWYIWVIIILHFISAAYWLSVDLWFLQCCEWPASSQSASCLTTFVFFSDSFQCNKFQLDYRFCKVSATGCLQFFLFGLNVFFIMFLANRDSRV